jgi:hypothetical protein
MGTSRLTRRLLTANVVAVLFALLVVSVASANANHQAIGRGTTTQFICANGVPNVATIQFSATKNKGVLTGSYQITGSSVSKGGSLNDGTITENSYSLTGVVNFDFCGTTFNQVVGTATLSGQCGTSVVIHYSDTLGQFGDFIGNVACS